METGPMLPARNSLLDHVPVAYRSLDAWPSFDKKTLDAEGQKRFDALAKGAGLLLANQPMSLIAKAIPVSAKHFGKLVRRGMTLKPDGSRIWGMETFAKYKCQSKRERTKDFEAQPSSSAGYGGMFGQLLDRFPSIESGLVEFLNSKGRPNRTEGHVLHVEFLRLCRAAKGLGEHEYPFETDSEASGPLSLWFKNVYMPKYGMKFIKREQGPDVAKALGYARGDGQAFSPPEPLIDWVLDEQNIDMHARYRLPSLFGGWDELELERFEIIRLRPVDIEMNLSWRLVLSKKASAHDIALLFFEAISGPPKAPAVVPGLDYLPGAGFPANVFPELRWQVPRVVWIDNALAHLADLVQNLVQRLWGGEARLGNPGTPKERPAIESSIKKHSSRIVQQLPQTTGSHPRDKRRKASAVPVNEWVHVDALEHTLDVYFANENVLPTDSAGGIPAFSRVQRMLASGAVQPNSLPSHHRRPHWFSEPVTRIVCADLKDGRPAHVNFMYTRYSSDHLKRQLALYGKPISLQPDFRNLQHVLAFDQSGAEIGFLTAEGIWGRFPADVRIRKTFGIHRKAGRLGPRADDEPLQRLYAYLRAGAPTDSHLALQLTYLVRYLSRNLSEDQLREMEMETVAAEKAEQTAGTSSAAPAPPASWSVVKSAADEQHSKNTANAPAAPDEASASPSVPNHLRLIPIPRRIGR